MAKRGRKPEERRHLRMIYRIPGARCDYPMRFRCCGTRELRMRKGNGRCSAASPISAGSRVAGRTSSRSFLASACLPSSFKACWILHIFRDSKIWLRSLAMAAMRAVGPPWDKASATYAGKAASSLSRNPFFIHYALQPQDPSHLIV